MNDKEINKFIKEVIGPAFGVNANVVEKIEDQPLLASALSDIVFYNSHEKWLLDISDKMKKLKENEHFTISDVGFELVAGTEKHTIWMLLVSALEIGEHQLDTDG